MNYIGVGGVQSEFAMSFAGEFTDFIGVQVKQMTESKLGICLYKVAYQLTYLWWRRE